MSSPSNSPGSRSPLTPIYIPDLQRAAEVGRFYRLVAATVGVLLALTLLVLLLGDHTAVGLGPITPGNGAEDVSTRTRITISFDRALAPDSVAGKLHFQPAQDGDIRLVEDSHTLVFTPRAPWKPDTQYTVTLDAEVRGQAHGRLPHPVRWTFRTRPLRLAFLRPEPAPGETGSTIQNLWVADADGTGATQVTHEVGGVQDFDVSGDGAWLVYSAPTGGGTANLFAIHPDGSGRRALTHDPDAANSGVACSPVGNLVAYEHRLLLPAPGTTPVPGGDPGAGAPAQSTLDVPTAAPPAPPGPADLPTPAPDSGSAPPPGPALATAKLWLVQIDGTSLGPLRRGGAAPVSFGARWSADGEWLAYYEASATDDRNFIHAGHLGSPGEFVLPNLSGQTGALSPDGQWLVYSENRALPAPALPAPADALSPDGAGEPVPETRGEIALVAVQPVQTPAVGPPAPTVLSLDPANDDGSPTWSPTGDHIAFLRRRLDAPDAGTGIWVLTPPGQGPQEAPRVLTAPTDADDQAPAWSPDGTAVLFSRILRTAGPDASTNQVWVAPIDPQVGPARLLLKNASSALWLP